MSYEPGGPDFTSEETAGLEHDQIFLPQSLAAGGSRNISCLISYTYSAFSSVFLGTAQFDMLTANKGDQLTVYINLDFTRIRPLTALDIRKIFHSPGVCTA